MRAFHANTAKDHLATYPNREPRISSLFAFSNYILSFGLLSEWPIGWVTKFKEYK